MAIRTLLFDLGNVLLYFSHEQMCAQIARVCNVPTDRIRESVFGNKLQWRFERGELTEAAFHEAIEQAIGRPVDFHAMRRAAADIFQPNELLIPLLTGWKRDGYRLVLLSNTCVTHYEWVRARFDVFERFDSLVLSFEVGAVKPEEAIFRAALAAIDCPPSDCFYADDIAEYVEAGRSFGLQAEAFTGVRSLVTQLAERGVASPVAAKPD